MPDKANRRRSLYKKRVPLAEGLQAAVERSRQGPVDFGNITIRCLGPFNDDTLGEGLKFQLLAPRSHKHTQRRPGAEDRVVLWVLNGNGLGHFDLASSDHISLNTEANLLKAFASQRFKTVLASLELPGEGSHGLFRYKTKLWMDPLLVVYAIAWLIPAAYALASMLLFKHLDFTAPADLLPTPELAAELASLETAYSCVTMHSATDTGVGYLNMEQLAGNPMEVREFTLSSHTDLENLRKGMELAMPCEADPAKIKWLQQLREARADYSMDDPTLHTMGRMLTKQDAIKELLARDMEACKLMDLHNRMERLEITQIEQKMNSIDVGFDWPMPSEEGSDDDASESYSAGEDDCSSRADNLRDPTTHSVSGTEGGCGTEDDADVDGLSPGLGLFEWRRIDTLQLSSSYEDSDAGDSDDVDATAGATAAVDAS